MFPQKNKNLLTKTSTKTCPVMGTTFSGEVATAADQPAVRVATPIPPDCKAAEQPPNAHLQKQGATVVLVATDQTLVDLTKALGPPAAASVFEDGYARMCFDPNTGKRVCTTRHEWPSAVAHVASDGRVLQLWMISHAQ